MADLAFVFFPDPPDHSPDVYQSLKSFGLGNAGEWADANVNNRPQLDIIFFAFFVVMLIMANLLFYFRLWLLHESNKQWLQDTTLKVGNKHIRALSEKSRRIKPNLPTVGHGVATS